MRTADGEVALTARERDLLAWLVQRAGVDVSRDELQREVWGFADSALTRAVDATVRRLRTRIEQDPSNPRCLLTVHGEGYRFVPPDGPQPPTAAAPMIRLAGGAALDLARLEVWVAGAPTALTAQEAAILAMLADAAGRPVDGQALRRHSMGGGSQRALVNAISRIRAKIEPDAASPVALLSIRRRGYRLVQESAAPTLQPPPSLIGREDALRDLSALLTGGERLVVVIGPGGVGKTTLVLAMLATLDPRTPPRRRLLVRLEEARTPSEASEQIARALGIQRAPTSGLSGLGLALDALGPALVVLDDVDWIVAPMGAAVTQWLQEAPHLQLLLTARMPLEVSGERRLPLAPLPIGGDGPALQLLTTTAQRVDPDFVPTAAQRVDLEAIAEATGGLPLALALAAARLSVLGPAQLRARLDQTLSTLAGRDASRPARHRSMRACMALSWGLLEPPTRALLEGLALKDGEISAADAEGIAPDGLDPLEELAVLVSRGLVQRRRTRSAVWLRLMPLIRAYAAEQLADRPDEARRWQIAWAQHFARRLARFPLAMGINDELMEAIGRWRRDLTSLRSAVRWAIDHDEPVLAAQCALVTSAVEGQHGNVFRAVEMLEEVLALPIGDPVLRARVGLSLSWRSRSAGNFDTAAAVRARTLAEEAGLPRLIAAAEAEHIQRFADGVDQARQQSAALRARSCAAGWSRLEAILLLFEVPFHLNTETHREALPMCRRAIALLSATSDRFLLARAYLTYAQMLLFSGDLASAGHQLDLAEGCMNAGGINPISLLDMRGRLLMKSGQTEAATAALTEALREAQRSGRGRLLVSILLSLGRCAIIGEQVEEAWAWLEAAQVESERNGSRVHAAVAVALEGLLLERQGDREGARARLEVCVPVLEDATIPLIAAVWQARLAALLPAPAAAEMLAKAEEKLSRPDPESLLVLALARARIYPERRGETLAAAAAMAAREQGRISPDFLVELEEALQA